MLNVMRHLADVASLRGDPLVQRQLFINGLNELVGTTQGFFYVGDDWRTGKPARFVHQTLTRTCDPIFLKYAAEFGVRLPLAADAFCDQSMADSRAVPVLTLADVLPDSASGRRYAWFADAARSVRMRDAVISFYRLPGTDRMAGVGMHLFGGRRGLLARQVEMVSFAVTELGRLIERGAVALPPVVATVALSPRLRQVFDRLLDGEAPSRIAHQLGLSLWTVREHVQRIYRHFGVTSRDQLMARSVSRNAGDAC